MKVTMQTPVTELSGVGDKRAKSLSALGISTVRDLVYYFPRAYENRGDVCPLGTLDTEEVHSYVLTVATEVRTAKINKALTLSKFRAFDESGSVEIVYFNAPFVKDIFHIGSVFRFFGKLSVKKRTAELVNPKYEPYVEGIPLPDFFPLYREGGGVNSKFIHKLLRAALSDVLPSVEDPLPEEIRIRHGFPTLSRALLGLHFPTDAEELKLALRRIGYDEMLEFALLVAKTANAEKQGNAPRIAPCDVAPFLNLLKFDLTNSQKAAVNDIFRDMTAKRPDGTTPPMSRMVVGDVGCGKTVVAALAVYLAVKNGKQAALMAPTEILARQHCEELSPMLEKLGFRTALLLGATKAKEKAAVYEDLASGKIDFIIGTHALLTEKTVFSNLALVITDEQHRFGVRQRTALREKSESAHLLVMSATPIPRTLALSLWGDLDVSRITEMPKGRMRVDTYAVGEDMRARITDFIEKQVADGGQVYVVCPAVAPKEVPEEIGVYPTDLDGSMQKEEQIPLKNTVEVAAALQKALPHRKIDVLHGKMKPKEKEDVMHRFASGETEILVSTTVVEVGVNVPNASLMVVEDADRFGLSQLHQLRGRVGRGSRKSFCVLMSDRLGIPTVKERLETMHKTYDGYAIAEKDLMMRGPGDFFKENAEGDFRQSGGINFRIASLSNDTELLEDAFREARLMVERDPTLSLPEHRAYREITEAAEAMSLTVS